MSEQSIKAVLAEDHEITRLGMRTLLDHMKEVVIIAEATCGKSAVSKTMELSPDLVLMDIGLPGMDGIEATRLIKGSCAAKVIIITSHDCEDDVLAGLSAGADAYCLKGISGVQLGNAIRSVMDGGVWLDPDIARQVVQCIVRRPKGRSSSGSPAEGNPFNLSEREYEILCLLVEGLSNQQMADRLFLSAETIKTHMRHVMEKLSVADRTQAAVKAVREGLVPANGKSSVADAG